MNRMKSAACVSGRTLDVYTEMISLSADQNFRRALSGSFPLQIGKSIRLKVARA
jgi:hypothetical protein